MYTPDELQLRKFVTPELVFGSEARHLAGRYAKNLGARKVLVVTDPGVENAGWVKQVIASLEAAELPYAIFASVSENPRTAEVMEGAEFFLNEHCNVIVAVGGGSPIDCAKGIGIVSSNRKNIWAFEGIDRVSYPMPPLICIPTTGGTSADVSQMAVIRDAGQRVKFVIGSKAVVPDVALVDPDTLTTMDSYLTACTGLDALTHAIEAFVSNASSPLTDVHALEGIRLVSANLAPAIEQPDNLVLRGKIMLGSLEAGLAFSNAILGANHSLAHSLGGFFDLQHGECNAVLLNHVIDFNYPSAPDRFRLIGEAMGLDLRGMNPGSIKKALFDKVAMIQKTVGIDRTLKELGVDYSDIPELAQNALKDPCLATNPRRANQRDLEVIYEESL